MPLQLRGPLPDTLPGRSGDLLRVLDALVPRAILHPGDNIDQTLYQSGARDLVDMLVQRFTQSSDSGALSSLVSEDWYGYDLNLAKYIEGGQ